MEIVIGIIAIVEAVIIVALLLYFIHSKQQQKVFLEQAEEIKKRRVDLDDIEIKNQKSDQVIMADAINAIKNNMQTFLESTKSNVVVLSDAISELSQGATQNEEGATRISQSLSEVVSKIEEQTDLVGSCLNLIEDNTSALTEIDSSVKNIGGLLRESVDSCKSGVDSLENYEGNMKSISDNLARSEEILVDFSKKITEINEIGSFIVDISESLKLLALNASIEAARVGAAGIGFTVVAKEMGVMSEKTQEGIGTINEILGSIIESSDQVNKCIMECVEVFDNSKKEFDAVSASFRIIDKQSGVINGKMQDISNKIDMITSNSQVTRERAGQAFRASETITAGTQEISQVSVLTSYNSRKISEHVSELDSMLNGIQTLLKQFTTSVRPVPQKAGRKVKIGVFCILDNDFWYSVRRGVIYAKKELEEYGAEVRYIPYTSWDQVGANYVNDVENLIQEGFDGFAFPGFMTQALESFQKAYKMGKKIFAFNCDVPPDSKRDACFQPDVNEAGAIAGKAMEKALNKSGKVVILAGDLRVPVNGMRSEGFTKQLEKNKGIKILDSVYVEDNDEDTYKKTVEVLKKYPDVNGIYITTGHPLPAAKAIEESGKKVSLVVFDHSDEIFSYIKKGIISAAIGQDPFGQGHDPIVWMYNCIMNDDKLPAEIMKCRSNVVDRDNVESLIGV